MESVTLRKLPLWGETEETIDFTDETIGYFEWPKPENFAQMQPEVYLESIEFETVSSKDSKLASVRVNLSNGESSPVF